MKSRRTAKERLQESGSPIWESRSRRLREGKCFTCSCGFINVPDKVLEELTRKGIDYIESWNQQYFDVAKPRNPKYLTNSFYSRLTRFIWIQKPINSLRTSEISLLCIWTLAWLSFAIHKTVIVTIKLVNRKPWNFYVSEKFMIENQNNIFGTKTVKCGFPDKGICRTGQSPSDQHVKLFYLLRGGKPFYARLSWIRSKFTYLQKFIHWIW